MARDVVDLTARLVEVDTSPGHSTGPLVELLVELGREAGAVARVQDGSWDGVPQHNLALRFGGDGPAGLVLAGHLDTVPYGVDKRANLVAERDGRKLYGRGTCDMKGALAGSLLAAASRAERLARPVVLLFSYAEELGCHGAELAMSDPALVGDVSDAVCLVGEPTGLTPILGHKGYACARLSLGGEPAHSSDPWAGADASVALASLLRSLHGLRESLRAQGDPASGHDPPCTTLNTGLVSAGSARNVVPDRAEVSLEVRPLPGTDERELRARIDACLRLACAAAPGVTGDLEWLESRPPFSQDGDDPLVQWLVERTGLQPGVVPFYTEAELYRRGMAIPTVVCGPGSIAQAHREDESVLFDQLEAGQELYAQAIDAFCR
jgi:acetylornithine deacetylase